MNAPQYDVVIVGAGHAGLAMAGVLRDTSRRFVVLERGEIGETWRTQRWDSFTVNTPNWASQLPGSTYQGTDPDGFYTRDELVASFEQYARDRDLPIRTGTTVTSVARTSGDSGFTVDVQTEAGTEQLTTRAVVVASGILQTPRIPAVGTSFPAGVAQLHAAEYRNADALPPGAVVVVGSAQSGCQIAEDLLDAGRRVYLCTSKVARLRRRLRGRDTLGWLIEAGFFDQTPDDLEDPAMQFAAQPQISGVGRYGHTVSLQQLQRDGATLMGRLTDISDGVLSTDDSLREHIAFADQKSAEFSGRIDAYIAAKGVDVPEREPDPADVPADEDAWKAGFTRLDLREANVSAIVWCTGFTGTFDWIRLPVIDDRGAPIQDQGVSPVPGLYFLGFPWMRRRSSGIIYGAAEDARYIAERVSEFLDA